MRPNSPFLSRAAITFLLLLYSREAFARQDVRAPVICLDPGHPSERNDGKKVVNGISEVHACWLVATRMRSLLVADGVKVVMTKSGENQFVSNRDRAGIANRARANLFLRLHCDSGKGSGFAVYYPDRKGRAFGRTGPSVKVLESSKLMAERFHSAFAKELSGSLNDNSALGDSKTFVGKKQGALTGSIFSAVPAVTVEMCVLDNPKDAAFMKSEGGREKMARALALAAKSSISTPAGSRKPGR